MSMIGGCECQKEQDTRGDPALSSRGDFKFHKARLIYHGEDLRSRGLTVVDRFHLHKGIRTVGESVSGEKRKWGWLERGGGATGGDGRRCVVELPDDYIFNPGSCAQTSLSCFPDPRPIPRSRERLTRQLSTRTHPLLSFISRL
ncbi:hypothetical protein R1flu_012530 [Riccia fluitans]|uniref:Uncharacterized protein n=1 Tax=Riccia fluitans TaxID=41844 RepID=A0ABD1ZC12_9MARC